MTRGTKTSNDDPLTLIRELEARVAAQESELAELRARIRPTNDEAGSALKRRQRKMTRAGLLKMVGVGAAAATAVGLELSSGPGSALASDGDSVAAGKETLAEHGTTVTYNGPAGFTGAVLLGNDSTDENGGFNYPAAVAGIAGAGGTAGAGGLVTGMYGYTDNGAGNGVVGYNSNAVAGSGNGVLGAAFADASNGVHGTNTTGTGVLGESGGGAGVMGSSGVVGLAHNPANYAAGIRGHHDGLGNGIGVYGSQAGAGWGGYFTSASGIGINTDGGTGIGVDAGGVTGVLARGRPGVASVGLQAIGATGVVAESNADTDGIGVSSTAFTSIIATGSNGSGGIGVNASGETAVMATGLTVGVQASGLTGIIATGSDAAVFGSISGSANGAAVHGLVNTTSPGPDSSGVLGANSGTNGKGCGVRGAHAGGGPGGQFSSATGPGVVTQGAVGLRATGTKSGIEASSNSTSANAVAIRGEITSASPPSGSAGVLGKNDGSGTASVGVRGVHGGTGNGVNGTSAGGRGGVFQGGAAQLRLQPSTHATHPTTGLGGDLFLDSSKRLWLCVKGGSKAVWKQIQLK